MLADRHGLELVPTSLQGIHAEHVMVVLDEGSGVATQLWEDAEKLVVGDHHRLIAIGNPDHEGSTFHARTVDPTWHHLRLSCLDAPTVTGVAGIPADAALALVQPEWVRDRADRYGVGSPTWMRQVTGEFPAQREDGIIPLSWLRGCASDRAAVPTEASAGPAPELWGRPAHRVQLGVD